MEYVATIQIIRSISGQHSSNVIYFVIYANISLKATWKNFKQRYCKVELEKGIFPSSKK